jgi:hypothetical protein
MTMMMTIVARPIQIPDFSASIEKPEIPPSTYEARCRAAFQRAARDWLVVYGDREHFANMMFLSGFDPRFEEALLLLGAGERRVLVVGNECLSYADEARLPGTEVVLCQSLSLMGQDRSAKPKLADVLRAVGLRTGDSIAIAGWKYLEPEEWDGETHPGSFVPAYMVDVLKRIVGNSGAVTDETAILMHPETGLRAAVDADQIAAFEWAAARSSVALWRIITGIRSGESELKAASRMRYAGDPLSVHTMLASGGSSHKIQGLRSPTARRLQRGDGVVAAIGMWGGLSARGGLLAEEDDAFLKTASGYFEGLIAWYDTADIGARGGEVFDAVAEALARTGLRSALNPGHLTGHDEWVHTPIRPRSKERIASGMPFQVDIIPAPMPAGWTLNCEDAVTFADSKLRAELRARHTAVSNRIDERRAFIQDVLGVQLKETILPMSAIPLCLPPFWLSSHMLLTRA